MKAVLLCLLLTLALTQTNFKNTCQDESLIPKLGTGLIHLNPLDTYNQGANKNYYQDLTINKFETVDVISHGFALSGFEGSCTSAFYTLVIDKVTFENQNTRMRIVVDFRNPVNEAITTWNKVSFTYIVVSRTFSGSFSDIWATVAEIENPQHNTLVPIDSIGGAYQVAPALGVCNVYQDPNIEAGPAGCNTAVGAAADGSAGGDIVVHAYIMGFRWNPAQASVHYLYAGIKTQLVVNPATSETADAATVTGGTGLVNIIYGGAGPFGPQVAFTNPTGALNYIKVAFVISRLDRFYIGTANPATYPSGSALLYSSSYVFTQVSTFNTAVVLQRGLAGSATEYNQLYYHLPDTRYAIYGITNFELPKNSASACETLQIDATLNNIDTYTMTTPNTNPTAFFFQADIFTVNIDQLCQPASGSISNFVNTVGKKSLFTVPTQSVQQYILEESQALPAPIFASFPELDQFLVFRLEGANTGTNDTILYRIEVPFTGLTAGSPLKFQFGFIDTDVLPYVTPTPSMVLATEYSFKLEVNGLLLYQIVHTAVDPLTVGNGYNFITGAINSIVSKGININSVTATAVITISFLRNTVVDQRLFAFIRASQYTNAYDPTTGCCPLKCPALTGLDVQNDPPVCIYCNTASGLVYNPNQGSCTCQSGFYLDATKTFQCFPCSALYCDVCLPTDPTKCTTCVTGATLDNVTLSCTCGNGFYVSGTECKQCPYPCQNCSSPTGSCIACVDSTRRDSTQNCKCITGFFDVGVAQCSVCSQTCLTCTDSTACTTCDAGKFRSLVGSVCLCMEGYYEFYHTDQTRTCERCNPECLTCSTSPALCLTCDPTRNRVAGIDVAGRQTCLCPPGFYSNPDGSCAQSNCNADPFCAQCEQGLKLCISCLASKNRVIKLPESICVCMDGYYPDTNNTCVPCKSGCSLCRSATNCSACVPLATPSNDGSCACPDKTYFTVSADGVRYCAACGPNCLSCVDVNTCTTCLTSYTKTADNKCVCGTRRYIAANGDCLPCATGCDKCTSANVCVSCIAPLLLQGNTCQVSCNNGFTAIGSVCEGCSTGCLRCTQNLICYYCADGFYMYKGNCYSVCPAGTIGDKSTGNWVCSPCNSPCKTCINHPSYCTSCLNGMGYLQTSAVQQSCVLSCVDGTYPEGGVCQVCDFRCGTCLGSATNCISCPADQFLYKGGCWSQCPAISLQRVGQNASCTDSCPDGFHKASVTECAPCAIECTTCEGGPRNCTSCLHGSVSINGSCTVQCGENEFSFQGFCIACSQSCYGCRFNPQNCLSCATGYVKTGSICQKGCLSHQFYQNSLKKCVGCNTDCATCSSFNFCTSCKNSAITPRGGVCSSCPYPCASCDGSGSCTSCLSGFFYFQGACRTSCPYGARPLNGVCQCESGIVSLGQCVTSCGSGFTAISGSCQPCNSNCAECSSDVNSCTSCISGHTIDTQTRRCVSDARCSYGQGLNGGVCVNICDPGFFFYEGICIYGGCFNGYAPNAYGGCSRESGQSRSKQNCLSSQFTSNGQCVGTCGNGLYPDYTSRQCLPCSPNCDSCFGSSFCVVCTNGYRAQNGVCTKGTLCTSGQLIYYGQCTDSCPQGTYSDGQSCMRVCSETTYYYNQMCFPNCPTPLRTPEACVNQCPTGTTPNNGICL